MKTEKFPKRDNGRFANRDGKKTDRKSVKSLLKRGARSHYRDDNSSNYGKNSDYLTSREDGFDQGKERYRSNERYSNERYSKEGYSRGYSQRGRERDNDSYGQKGRYDKNRDLSPRKKHEERKGDLTFRTAKEVKSSRYKEVRFDNKEGNTIFRKPKKYGDDYNPNNKYSHKKQFEYQQKNVDFNAPVRLNKYLSNAGICSRREADEYIKAGVISVNGEIVTELGTKVLRTDKVMFHNEAVQTERKRYVLLNKPKDCVTTTDDTHARLTVMDLVRTACSERIYPVGRLDRNTTGVLLLSNDGELSSRLTHPKYEKKKIYHAVLDKEITKEDFDKITEGVDLEEFFIKPDALSFVKEDNKKEVGIELHTGQNRVVRRIFESLGYRVVRLDRVLFAGLTKKGLSRGKYRHLTPKEVNFLKMGVYK